MFYTKTGGAALDGALAIINVNGSQYQLGKDASNTEGGIMKLFGGSGALETYKTSTDGTYNAKIVYDELSAIKTAIGADGETSVVTRVGNIEDALGEGFSSSNTVADAISAAQAAATYDDTALAARVTAAEGSISTLTAGASTQGSVAYQIAQIVAGADASFDTLKEIADWILSDTTGAAKMASDISDLQTAVAAVDYSGKADKVASATSGNFAGLDSNGNLTDSGKKASDFVAAESGKRLMTDAEGTKLSGIATGAQVNVIESVSINGSAITPDANKAVDLGSNFVQDANYVHTDNNYTTAEKNKLGAIGASVSGNTLTITTQVAA